MLVAWLLQAKFGDFVDRLRLGDQYVPIAT